MFNKLRIQSLDNSSVIVKFHVFFVVLALVPMGILMYLYWQLKDEGTISVTVDELNTALIFATIGVACGYVAMRMLLKNLVDVSRLGAQKLRDVLGPQKVQDFLKGDENEIALLTKTFHEISSRLEENVTNLEATKKTLQSVLTRVGQGISNVRNLDTFLDLIVQTVTEALGGRKGFLLLCDPQRQGLVVRTAYGVSNPSDKKHFSVSNSPFSAAFQARHAIVIPKIQSLSRDEQALAGDLDFPLICAPLLLRDEVLGVLAVSGKKNGATFQDEEMSLFLELASQTAVAIDNSRANENVDKTYFETLVALAMAVEAKDSYSRGHLERVAHYCAAMAAELRLSPDETRFLQDAARVHDLGKIGVSDDVLSKPGPLNEQEWIMMRRHPEIGASMIKPVAALLPLWDPIRHHHEKLDGSGYPDKLAGEQISLPARILGVANMYDALTTDRPYRNALAMQDALRFLRDMGDKIDQNVVAALERILQKNI